MRFWLSLVLSVALAGPALAGAWPREKGTVFLSVTQRVSTEIPALRSLFTMQPDSYSSVFAEYGATERLTFGLDAGYAGDGRYGAMGFARYALGRADARHRFALVAGAGLAGPPGEMQVQLGAAWGTGLSLGEMTGWAGLEASALHRLGSGETVAKADLTLGLKPAAGWMAIFQLQSGKYPGSAAYLRAAPSVVLRTGASGHLQIGADIDLLGSGRVGASVSTWIEF